MYNGATQRVSSFCYGSLVLNIFLHWAFFRSISSNWQNFEIFRNHIFRKLFIKNIGCIKQPQTLYVCVLQVTFTLYSERYNAWEWSYGKHDEPKFTGLNIVWVGTILDRIFWITIIRVGTFQVRVILGGNFPGGSYPEWGFSGWELSGWELSWVGIFLGGGFPCGNYSGGIIRVGIFRVGVFLVSKIVYIICWKQFNSMCFYYKFWKVSLATTKRTYLAGNKNKSNKCTLYHTWTPIPLNYRIHPSNYKKFTTYNCSKSV